MKLDIKKAIESPFVDKKWYIKLIFPSIITYLGVIIISFKPYLNKISINVLIFLIVTFSISYLITGIICAGFFVQLRHNFIENIQQLPTLKGYIGEYFSQGFNVGIINIIYAILCKALELIGQIPVKGLINLIFGVCLLCAYILLLISGAFSQNIYADTFYFHKAFEYKRIFSLMSKVKKETFIYFMFFCALTFCMILIIACLPVLSKNIHIAYKVFLAFLYPMASVICVLLLIMFYNLQAQIYRIAKFRLENNQIK